MFAFLLLLIPVIAHTNYDSNCFETENRFGIPFCIQCQPNYKITTFNKCVPCSSDSECSSSLHQSNTQFYINKYYASKDYQYYKNYPYYHQDTTQERKNVYDMTFSGFIKQDPNCIRQSSTGRCFKCKIQYEYNQKTRLCERKAKQNIEEKMKSLNCLFFSAITSQCLECSTNYGRRRDGTCVYGIKDEDLSSDGLNQSHNKSPIEIQSRENVFERNQIQIPIKEKEIDTFRIDYTNQRLYFLVDQKFYDGQHHGKSEDDSEDGDNNKDDDSGDSEDESEDESEDDQSQRETPIIQFMKNCKSIDGGKCKKCKEGYILNLLIEGANKSPCAKISSPIISLFSNKFEEGEDNEIQKIITQHLRKHQQFYKDDKCMEYNANQNANEPKCLKCLSRHYFSFEEEQCIQVDEKCKKYNPKNGYCYYCKYGYMPVSGKCKLINSQNYKSGYYQYYSSYRPTYHS